MTHSTQHIGTDVQAAAEILRRGGLVAVPTETVYGLACDARNPEALRRLYAVKGRPGNHPVIVHLADVQQLADWAINIPEAAYELADVFWPGPMTLILHRHPSVPDAVTGGQDTVGIRIPNHPFMLALLEAFGGGLAAPSANRFGHISPTTAEHVRQDLGKDVDYILDGGPCPVGVESTIIDMTVPNIADLPADWLEMMDEDIELPPRRYRILRPGMLLAEDLQSALENTIIEMPGMNVQSDAQKQPASNDELPLVESRQDQNEIRVSGNLASHYAPKTPARLVKPEQLAQAIALSTYKGKRVAVLHIQSLQPHEQVLATQTVLSIQATAEPGEYARQLYANLRRLDDGSCDIILIEAPGDESSAWAAVQDRLRRATS